MTPQRHKSSVILEKVKGVTGRTGAMWKLRHAFRDQKKLMQHKDINRDEREKIYNTRIRGYSIGALSFNPWHVYNVCIKTFSLLT